MQQKIEWFRNRYFHKSYSIREQLFYIVCMGTVFAGIISEVISLTLVGNSDTVLGTASAIVIVLICIHLSKKQHKKLASVLACITVTFFIFPYMFFHMGGIHSGMPLWILLGLLLDFMLLEGLSFHIIIGLNIVLDIAIFFLSYHKPELIGEELSIKAQYMDILQSVIILGVMIGLLGRIQIRMYQKKCNELERALVELERANQIEKRFMANMSHEIRTPITAIMGMNEMICRESKENHTLRYASDIHAASQMLLTTVNDILDFSKIEENKMTLVPVEYSLAKILEDLVRMLGVKAREKGLTFRINVDKNLPTTLIGDDVRLRQIISNLLYNAVKYTSEGCVTLTVTTEVQRENCRIYVNITDTGRGIREEDQERLFQRYFRVEDRISGDDGGSGLGLVICKELLQMMGSDIILKSEYGKGTSVSFSIVQKVVDRTPVGDFERIIHKPLSPKEYHTSFRASKATVLAVDDNETNLRVFKGLLKYTGVNVVSATNGKEAVELVEKQHFDAIFMDHMMPEMNGIEAMKAIRKIDALKGRTTPIAVVTANALMGNSEMYLSEGFDAYLSKPIVFAKLEKILREFLPDDLIEENREEDAISEKSEENSLNSFVGDLPKIDGIFWEPCMEYLPDKEALLEAVETFYNSLDREANIIAQAFDNIAEPDSLNTYRIHVHGMKSAAKLVGALPLSGMAKSAEEAAKKNDLVTIQAITPILLENIALYKERLRVMFPEKELEKVNEGEFRAWMKALDVAIREEDLNQADALVETLKQYSYPSELQKHIDRLIELEINLDWDGMRSVFEQIEKMQ